MLYRTFILLILLALQPATAELYRWTDENGKVHYSDRPARDQASEEVKTRISTYESVSYSNSDLGASKEVILYSASWCGHCKKAKRYFEANGIAYKEYDVEKSQKGKADYRKLNAKGVPVILVGNKRMNGFSESGFNQLYQRAQSTN